MSNFDQYVAPRQSESLSRVRRAKIDRGLRAYMLGVYNNMALGLLITGLVAFGANLLAVSTTPTAYRMGRSVYFTDFGAAIYESPLRWLIMLAPLGMVFFFSFRIKHMAASTARAMFLAFSAAMGLSLSSILLVYAGQSVVQAFFVTSAAFGSLSLYGYTTRRDLSALGSFLVMGLFGLVIASLFNLFVQSSGFQFGLSILSVLIFSGLTAWDTQAIREIYSAADGEEMIVKKSINGALMLYLDFVNIFQSLLYLMGNRNS